MTRFFVINLNPTFQRTIELPSLQRGEVNRADFKRFDIAGKGVNTMRVLQQLGASARLLTHLGEGRDTLLRMCGEENLDILWEPSISAVRTCITLIDTSSRKTTEVVEPSEAVEADMGKRILRRYDEQLPEIDWLILSGSRTPGYSDTLFVEFTKKAVEYNIPVVADFRGPELKTCLDAGLNLVKINMVEFVQTFLPQMEVSETDDDNVLAEVKVKLKELSKSADYVISRGGRDVLIAHSGRLSNMAVPKVNVRNTIGSGDAFCAALCFALSQGRSLEEAVREGARCGSVNAGILKPGSIVD